MSQYQPLYNSFETSIRDRYVPTARMSVSASVYLPGSEVDIYTGQVKPDRQRRRRTQAKILEAERLEREEQRIREAVRREESKGGVRVSMRFGVLFCAAVLFVCGLILLYQQGQIVQRQKMLNALESEMRVCRSQNMTLESRIAEASDASVICYAASQELGMVPAETISAIHLTAADTRPNAHTGVQTQEQQIIVASLESQTTPVPMIASN